MAVEMGARGLERTDASHAHVLLSTLATWWLYVQPQGWTAGLMLQEALEAAACSEGYGALSSDSHTELFELKENLNVCRVVIFMLLN